MIVNGWNHEIDPPIKKLPRNINANQAMGAIAATAAPATVGTLRRAKRPATKDSTHASKSTM